MKNIIKAVFTLTVFSASVRVLGFGFRVFLSRRLGGETMGVYSIALSVYFAALTLTSGGLPLVVSRRATVFRVEKNPGARDATVSAALIFGAGASVLVSAIFAVLSLVMGRWFFDARLGTVLLLLLPGVAATAAHSAFYGALWGEERYFAVSATEFTEQVLRIGFFFIMLALFTTYDGVYSAAISLSLACAGAALLAMLIYFKTGGKLKNPRGRVAPLARETAPITGMRLTGSAINSFVSVAMPLLLAATAGMTKQGAVAAFGTAAGMALPLLFLPGTLVGSLAVALVPELSAKMKRGDLAGAGGQIGRAVIFSVVVAALTIPPFFAAGARLGLFLYGEADAGYYLAAGAWIMLPASVEQIASSVMNSLDLELKSYRNYLVTLPLLFACVIFLPRFVGMHAYFIGIGATNGVQALLHIWDIRKKTGMKTRLLPTLLKGVAVTACAASVGRVAERLLPSGVRDLTAVAVCGSAALLSALLLCVVLGLIKIPKRFALKFPRGGGSGKAAAAKIRNIF